MTPGDEKRERVVAAIERREPDRVPIGEFFWTNFLRRCKAELDVGPEFSAYAHWDLDLIVINPNMDPHITGIEIIEDTPARKLVHTGFGATIERRADYPMPMFVSFDTETYEQMEALELDDPLDPRRYVEAIDGQLNSVGDDLVLGIPAWIDRVNGCCDDYSVFGSVCDPFELIWRIMGSENVLVKLAEEPERMGAFIEKLGDYLIGIVEGQVATAGDKLTGLYMWGDIAYDKGMLISPAMWRRLLKPQVARIVDAAHSHGLKLVYHGCGNASAVFEDLIEIGVDALNPLEAKSGLDVVDLKRRYGDRWSFNGNIDVTVLATNDRERVRNEVLTKLSAARGGGYILQSDHSVPDNVDPATYDYVIRLTREHGVYPLR